MVSRDKKDPALLWSGLIGYNYGSGLSYLLKTMSVNPVPSLDWMDLPRPQQNQHNFFSVLQLMGICPGHVKTDVNLLW